MFWKKPTPTPAPTLYIRDLIFHAQIDNKTPRCYLLTLKGKIPIEAFQKIEPILTARVEDPRAWREVPSEQKKAEYKIGNPWVEIDVCVFIDDDDYKKIQMAILPFLPEEEYSYDGAERGISLVRG